MGQLEGEALQKAICDAYQRGKKDGAALERTILGIGLREAALAEAEERIATLEMRIVTMEARL